MISSETLVWYSADEPLDDECTVLVQTDSGDVDTAFKLDGLWRWQNASLISGRVMAWAHLPSGPNWSQLKERRAA